MNKGSASTVLTVVLTLVILTGIMMISLTATTEADESFKPNSEQEASMDAYYASCPFTKAEQEDLTATPSIREAVKFVSVECDQEKKTEKVTLELLGNKEESKQKLEEWLKKNTLQKSDLLQITLQ